MTRSVLITGASTGIGEATALHLASKGMTVFAGVRKEADGQALVDRAEGALTPVIVDVADGDSIASCKTEVMAALGDADLDGLVNNAGITVQGLLEYLPLDDLRRQLEVNVTGQLAVTQAFLPTLRKTKGRIVFVSSIAGRTPSLPFIGPYSASKSALECLADAFRVELRPTGIQVALIEPGSIATPIWDKGDATFEDLVSGLPDEAKQQYGASMERARKLAAASGRRGIPALKVAVKIEHALTASHAHARYLVGNDARLRAYVESPLPERIRDSLIARTLRL